MTIDVPELGDKSYEELLEEAEKRLPAYDDGWTDYNPSDPGVTILELFAYLTDTYTYQLDTVTDDHREKYLQLMGERPRPPEPASIQLSLSPPDGGGGTRVPAGTKLRVIDGSDSDKIFETDDDVFLTDATVEAVVTEHGEGRTDHTQANSKEGMFYRAFGKRAVEGSALYLGFDGDPFEGAESLALTVDFHDEDLPPTATHGDDDPRFFPSVNVRWEYCVDYENARRTDAWCPLPVARDGTYAFYRGGRITLTRPDGWAPDDWERDEHGVVGQDPGPFWLRCRILEGGYEIPPQFNGVTLNVVEASHRSTVEDEELTRSDRLGDPSTLTEQRYEFRHAPVLEADITVDGTPWTEVDDFDASGPTDRHYVLERRRGAVRFGDGVTGRMPEPDATVVAEEYAFGGGPEGNVPASSVWRFPNRDRKVGDGIPLGDISITAESAGTGGTDGESLDGAFRRTKGDLSTPYRAVTTDDYRYVATHTPGLRFGRATVLVDERSGTGLDAEPTEIRVVVVPYAPLSQPRPEPSEGFLDAVRRHIDKYRLVTDRVSVEAPNYVDLSFDVEVQTSTWTPESRVQRAVQSRLAEYLNPIHGYEGDGWPFGRPFYVDEVSDLLESVERIDNVRDVSLHARGKARVDGDGNVLIDDSTLFALDGVDVEVKTVSSERNGE
ncbi:putative baseplate assembly protein [Halobacteriales archaeon QH_2_65_14]|nr:MAG: putative baseplate assembly protein [Halobacteriales archaeon QH_2_65_14]